MADNIRLFGIAFDRLRMDQAVERIVAWCRESAGARCRYVVTPNVDHAVMYQQHKDLRAAYADAALVLVDGMPLVWASRLLRRPLPERVAGSDLVPALFDAMSNGAGSDCVGDNDQRADLGADSMRVFLLGAAPDVAEEAARRVHAKWPGIAVVGTDSPPLGFERDGRENERILHKIADAAPDILIVGLGAPKQELWTHAHRLKLRVKVVICAGATIDFLAGHKTRSPRWMRRIGLEWLHRMLSEPRRLARRYARDAWVFPKLVWREWRAAGN